jgi:hypothetical protein
LYEIPFCPACRSILPEVSIEVLDLPKASAIDYIVDAGNKYKVWYRNKMIRRWNLRHVKPSKQQRPFATVAPIGVQNAA